MGLGFLQQESFIFFPEKLPQGHQFDFGLEHEEVFISAKDGVQLHGLLFKANAPKGLVFYLHGNAGCVASWGSIAPTYTRLGYDIFMLDYRGYGKSGGQISNERQFYEDVQAAYDHLKAKYQESTIVVAGYSIGSAAAAMLAAHNSPRLLLLQAPYYSLSDLVRTLYPFLPVFMLKYKFETFRFVEGTMTPIVLFHGDQDEIIYHGSSKKLKAHLKPTDKIIILKGQRHNGMNENPDFQRELAKVLTKTN
ncbi:alpha/beta hydrolase [Pontibacter litorisediminis]|uniref:alpha/beta hydrolase n=1 Tax=Pontibacter litorisediminis TaxID=1846260 RepID=UPI0023ED5866|nr:alpha/beta fold hydrolase [Pontibacter litorisediminis]